MKISVYTLDADISTPSREEYNGGYSKESSKLIAIDEFRNPLLFDGVNLSNANMIINAIGERGIQLGGYLETDLLRVKKPDNSPIIDFRGDDAIHILDSVIGLGVAPVVNQGLTINTNTYATGIRLQGGGTYGINANGAFSYGGSFQSSKANGIGGLFKVNGATGTNKGGQFVATTANTGNNTAGQFQASGASGNNFAIDIISGNINTTGGIGISGTYSIGGALSGDIDGITYTNGIVTNITIAP